jgi:serine/threonine protein kinase
MSLKDFKIKKFIGKGTYGTVYKVIRNSDGQTYVA